MGLKPQLLKASIVGFSDASQTTLSCDSDSDSDSDCETMLLKKKKEKKKKEKAEEGEEDSFAELSTHVVEHDDIA
jgi:hypothetical protein